MIRPNHFPSSRRAVSSVLSYSLTITITTVLMTGLIVGTTGIIEDQRRQSIRNELSVVGERLATELTGVDRLVYVSADANVTLRTTHPATVAGSRYDIEVQGDSEPPCAQNQCLVLTTTNPAVTVTVPFTTETTVEDGRVPGGPVRIRYDEATGNISVVKG